MWGVITIDGYDNYVVMVMMILEENGDNNSDIHKQWQC